MRDYEYTGPAPVKKGDDVLFIDEDGAEIPCKVETVLATQMVLRKKGKPEWHKYVFYAERGVTWKQE